MKKILILGCFTISCYCVTAQTLFTYGRYKVDKEEFLRAFYKNNTGDKSGKAMRDYLDLFIAFKLKVQAARDLGLDTMPGQKTDLEHFRRQMEEEYSTDDSVVTALCNEAFHRSKTDVRVAHIFIPFDPDYINNMSPGAEHGRCVQHGDASVCRIEERRRFWGGRVALFTGQLGKKQ